MAYIYIFRFLAHNGHWKNYYPPVPSPSSATRPPKGNSNFVCANREFRGFAVSDVAFPYWLKGLKIINYGAPVVSESRWGKESLFCKYDSAAPRPRRCRRDCRSRAHARTHGLAHSCVFLLLDVPICHALHRSRCSRCFPGPFALRFSTFIRLLRLAFGLS